MYTKKFYVFFDCHISNIVNKNVFVWLFIYFNIIWIKTFCIDNIIEVVCAVFYIYILDFIMHFLFVFQFCYLSSEIVTNVFVFFENLPNNSKY